jgi:hypothetical protein
MDPLFRQDEANIDELLLDTENPRIPEDCLGYNQNQLLVFIADNYNAITVAKSIARHSYFPSEPLIVLEQIGRSVV